MSGSHGGGRNPGGGRGRGRNRDPNPPLLVAENVVAQIGGMGNLVNLPDDGDGVDPNTFHPAGVGGSEVVVDSTAPIGEGTSQYRQRAKKARHDLPISSPPPPPPPQLLQQPALRRQQQSREQPLPGPPAVHYPVDNMGAIPDALHGKDQLHELCTKKLSNRDKEILVITGRNRPFLIQEITRARLEFPADVFVHIINGPTGIVKLEKKKENSDKLTLLWAPLVASDEFRLVRGQLVDMWFDIDEFSRASIYISGDRLQN